MRGDLLKFKFFRRGEGGRARPTLEMVVYVGNVPPNGSVITSLDKYVMLRSSRLFRTSAGIFVDCVAFDTTLRHPFLLQRFAGRRRVNKTSS